jgi:cytochrome c55X
MRVSAPALTPTLSRKRERGRGVSGWCAAQWATGMPQGAGVRALLALPGLCMLSALLAAPATAQDLPASRQFELVRMVRQDCGSCHGMRLTGGLGPALTREALADKPLDGLAATIFYGRPATPMPPWRRMLSEAESLWIAQQLMQGFPEEGRSGR